MTTIHEPKEGYIFDHISGIEIKATPEEIQAVQVFSKQLVEDYGYPATLIQTRPQFRVKTSPSDEKKSYPVDIAVFSDFSKQEEDVYIIVECKKKTRQDGKTQLKDYLRLSRAFLGVWFNGEERLFLRKIEKEGRVEFEEIPNIPQYGQRLEDIGRFKRKDLKPTHNLKSTFKAIRNHLAANAVGATRDETLAQQIINIIFCKIYDERFTEPDNMVEFRAGIGEGSLVVKERIEDLFDKVKRKYKEVLDASDIITLDANSVVYVVGELQNYCLIEAERDVIADAFEVFIGHALKGGQGQFFTPRNVIKMMVEILDPDDEDLIIDPACGSGGFLIEALRHVWRKLDAEGEKYHWNKSNLQEEKMEVALNKIRGIDKDYFLAKVAKAYMAIIGDGKSGIFNEDSLENPANWQDKTRMKVDLGKFSVLLTNPPFGAKIPVRGEEKLKRFDFGYKWQYNKASKTWEKTTKLKDQEEPQVLFIERCLELLKDGGRMAMVLPSGILGNEREAYLRQYIQERGNLFAIVELPLETFSPNVTINASVLFIQKGKSDKKDIFVSINEYCGHDKKGRSTEKDDISAVSRFYFKDEHPNHNNFFIKREALDVENFVAKRYLQKYITNVDLINDCEYDVVDFGSIIESVHNGANIDDASIYVSKEEGIPYILVKSITKEGINFENLKYIKKSLEDNRDVVKNMVTENTIVMTRAGNSGIAANIPLDLVGGVASGFLINIKLKKGFDPYYVVAFLNSTYGQMQLERISSGSILKSIRSSDLKKVRIIIPPDELRDQIGNAVRDAVADATKVRKALDDANTNVNRLV